MKDIKKPKFFDAAVTSRSHSMIREMMMALLMFFVGTLLGSILQIPAMFVYFWNNQEYMEMVKNGSVSTKKILDMVHQMPDWMLGIALCANVGVLVAVMFYCTQIERRKPFSLGFQKKSCLFYYIAGLCAGICTLGMIYAICVMSGGMQVDVVVRKENNLLVLFLFLAGYLLEGMAEEVLCRGFLFVSLTKRYTVKFSLMGSSVFFALLKGMQRDMSILAYINLILFGCFMGLLFIRLENIWFVGAFHGIWDFIQTNIMGNVQTDFTSTLFSVKPLENFEILHGGTYGLESGLLVTLVLFVGIFALILEMQKRGMFISGAEFTENPYDKLYYEEFQRQFTRYYEEKNKEKMSAEEEPSGNSYVQSDRTEAQVTQTVFDQEYFKD